MEGRDQRAALVDERLRVIARLRALEEDVGSIVESAEGSNGDDEHDPEGATIAYERERTAALGSHTRRRLEEIDAALHALESGVYGTCTSCGAAIPAERLAALPGTRYCVRCSLSRQSSAGSDIRGEP
ncbi:MAG TPA: TraR/DksA C4-type zinc finger protein [Acidimicrobiales bacterium]|nr:TraR/DksA C4-type zinc finger protein [Acidimicrobiales bacterium]